jgi:hypothetical protein
VLAPHQPISALEYLHSALQHLHSALSAFVSIATLLPNACA